MTLLLQRHNANESTMQKINKIKIQQGTTYLDKATISSLQNKLCAEMGQGQVSSALTCDPFKLSSLHHTLCHVIEQFHQQSFLSPQTVIIMTSAELYSQFKHWFFPCGLKLWSKIFLISFVQNCSKYCNSVLWLDS